MNTARFTSTLSIPSASGGPCWRRCATGLLLAVSLAVSACGTQGKPVEDARVLRIIIVPAPQGGLDPASETGLAHLSRVAGVRLVYLRAMSGGSHLLATGVGGESIRSRRNSAAAGG